MIPLKRQLTTLTIREMSDPGSPLEYTGFALADHSSNVQHWTVLQTCENDEMLFIDDQHQSSKSDEYRYHETFVHTLMIGLPDAKNVLILGGAEGCMIREVLKWPNVEKITQVDWDDSLVNYFRNDGIAWNNGAYNSSKVIYVCDEATAWLKKNTDTFDAIFVDLLDPSDSDMAFMRNIIEECKRHLNKNGAIAVNAGQIKDKPSTACKVADFMKTQFVLPEFCRFAARVYVPSYKGAWCFLMAAPPSWNLSKQVIPHRLKYFNLERLKNNTCFDTTYQPSIYSYSLPSDSEKLAAESAALETKVFEHYGC